MFWLLSHFFSFLFGFFRRTARGYNFRRHMAELAEATGIHLLSVHKRIAAFTFYRQFAPHPTVETRHSKEAFEDLATVFDAEGKTLTFVAHHIRGEIELRVFSDIKFERYSLPSEIERENLKRRLSADDIKLDAREMEDCSKFYLSLRLAPSDLVPSVFETLLVLMADDALILEVALMLYCCERQERRRVS